MRASLLLNALSLKLPSLLPILSIVFIALPTDLIAFHIECPPDVTVSCDDELWDLSIYGTAYIYGYGSPQPAGDPEWVDYDLNSCGTGTIIRTWVAYDYSGTAHYCSQTLYVTGGGPGYIQWPPDYTINSCFPGETDPENLPPPYDKPVLPEDNACAQYMTGYEDQTFDLNPPACVKILRKWTVIDWCLYDPNSYHPQGIWKHTQIIKIVPEDPPEINCPKDTMVTADLHCYGGVVNLPPATGFGDCGVGVSFKNNSPYAFQNGADISGHYPLGVTIVKITADDGCGQKSSCKVKITVKDLKKPTPVCYYGLSVSLMQMPDGYYLDLQPEWFNKASYDNCTPKHELEFDIEPRRVGCEDLGETPVKVFVIDSDGNSSYCNTYVHVQDNMGMCPPTSGMIAGNLMTPRGHTIQDVQVFVEEESTAAMSDEDGHYAVPDLPFALNYTVRPDKEPTDIEGVTTLDMIILLKHLLGVQSLESPYQYIAADLDGNQHVTIHDLIAMRSQILHEAYGAADPLPWQFVDASHTFADPSQPFLEEIPGVYQIQDFHTDMLDLDFVGVKIGDLNDDGMDESMVEDLKDRREPIDILIQTTEHEAGGCLSYTFSLAENIPLAGFQFTINFDYQALTFQKLSSADLPMMHEDNFNFALTQEGRILVSWANPEEQLLNAGQTLFTLDFNPVDALGDNMQLVGISSDVLKAEGYDRSLESFDIRHAWPNHFTSESSGTLNWTVENFPNPFTRETHFRFDVSKQSTVELRFFTIDGRQLHNIVRALDAGSHDIVVSKEVLIDKGMVFCEIRNKTERRTMKLIIE